MAAIDSAYQYYLSTYANTTVSRYDTHKKSQLRAVYNNIVKTNKESPLYKVKYSGDVQKFAIDIKEKTRSIQNVVASLSDSEDGIEHAFAKKVAQSSEEETVTAEYIGTGSDVDESVSFDVEVRELASPQINRGNYLDPDELDIEPGAYSFDLLSNLCSYEFQYNVGQNDTNRSIQQKLIRLVNSANIGLRAVFERNSLGERAVQITSNQTGLDENARFLFEIRPAPDAGSMKAMQVLGLDNVAQEASNSSFLLNGMERSSLSNTFTVNNAFSLTLKKTSHEGAPARIGFKTNTDAVADNIQSLVTVYNNIIQLGHNQSGAQQSEKLIRDMSSVAKRYHNELESIGLNLQSDDYISVDRSLLTDAVSAEDSSECFSVLNNFKNGLGRQASKASIDPMNYVNKLLVAYKNPKGQNFATPYITSIYSGMMMDAIC